MDYRLLSKCDLCAIVTKSNSNRNVQGKTHEGQTCTFSQSKEGFISSGDCRWPKFPSGGKIMASLESDSEFLSRERQSLCQRQQEYSQFQSYNHHQSAIVQNFELKYVINCECKCVPYKTFQLCKI